MEKFFEIKKNSELYTDYFKWVEDYKNIGKIYTDFAKKHGIESTRFIPRKNCLAVMPTARDEDKFFNEFTKNVWENGFRQFKVLSDIGKDWQRTVLDIPVPSKPHYLFYGIDRSGFSRLFNAGERLYGSFSSEYSFILPEWAIEIIGSEFYKIMETN